MMFGWFELMIIFGVIVLLFGASRLPKVARSMGLSVGKFKEGLKEGKQEVPEEDGDESATGESTGSGESQASHQ